MSIHVTPSASIPLPTMAHPITAAPVASTHSFEREITERVRGFLQENFLYLRPADFTLHDDDRLMERGVIDSMGVVEMISFLEDTYAFRVQEDEISEANLGTVRAITAFVSRKRPAVT
jgi:acyl carrier protein